jgi:hypothetical protein
VRTRRAAAGVVEIVVDTRERYAWKFSAQQATTARRALTVGDYAVELEGTVVGVVERKTLGDLAAWLVDGSLFVLLDELAVVPRAAVVVEDRWADVFRLQHVSPGMVAELLAGVQVRYPNVPIVFCETRMLAEQWAYASSAPPSATPTRKPTSTLRRPERCGREGHDGGPCPPHSISARLRDKGSVVRWLNVDRPRAVVVLPDAEAGASLKEGDTPVDLTVGRGDRLGHGLS